MTRAKRASLPVIEFESAVPPQGETPAKGRIGTIVPMRVVEPQAVEPLNAKEEKELKDCEAILLKGLATFFEVGSALLTIREKGLHRASHATFEAYCRERWNIGRSYASRVIGAAARVKLLSADSVVPKPANEFQMRPFLRLEPEEFPRLWEETVKQAKDGRVTPKLVQSILSDLKPTKARKPRRSPRKRTAESVFDLIRRARSAVESGSPENVMDLLAEIERLVQKL
jgi:hypothetical protein